MFKSAPFVSTESPTYTIYLNQARISPCEHKFCVKCIFRWSKVNHIIKLETKQLPNMSSAIQLDLDNPSSYISKADRKPRATSVTAAIIANDAYGNEHDIYNISSTKLSVELQPIFLYSTVIYTATALWLFTFELNSWSFLIKQLDFVIFLYFLFSHLRTIYRYIFIALIRIDLLTV